MAIVELPRFLSFLEAHRAADGAPAPLAVFDCDGTLIQGDIGEAMFYRQIERWWFKSSPAALWPDHPQRTSLDETFRAVSALSPRDRSMAPEFEQCAAMMISWYFDQIRDGKVIKACTDIVRLLSGFTLGEVQTFASETFADELAAPLSERRLGGRRLPRGIRYIAEAVEILQSLKSHGFEIWAVSGSCVYSIEPVFREMGIPPNRLIGIEMEEHDGILSAREVEPIPIRDGKIGAMQRRTQRVPVLSASDSRNDIPLLLYSSDLKVRINSRHRDTQEFFDAVGTPIDGSWINIEHPTILS
jgi:phosphoserine phosphatase